MRYALSLQILQSELLYDGLGINRMPKKWIHINYEVGDPWIGSIWTAVNDAENSGKAFPISKETKGRATISN